MSLASTRIRFPAEWLERVGRDRPAEVLAFSQLQSQGPGDLGRGYIALEIRVGDSQHSFTRNSMVLA